MPLTLNSAISINGKNYPAGTAVPLLKIYPFFLVHMLMFGLSGFFMAYAADVPAMFLFVHGGIAIVVYLVFYLAIFGREQVRWMFINSLLGLFGIYSEIDLILSAFDLNISNFAWYQHIIPFFYYILYTFLLRQMILDIFKARDDEQKANKINRAYVIISIIVYSTIFLLT